MKDSEILRMITEIAAQKDRGCGLDWEQELAIAYIDGMAQTRKVKVARKYITSSVQKADAIRKISLDIHNNLDEKETSLYLSNIAIKISGTAGSSAQLERDKETIKQNIEEEDKNPMSHCWFCQTRIKNQTSSLSEKMHKVTGTERTISGKRIHYRMYELTIPRCALCAGFHNENEKKYTKIGIGVGLVSGIVISLLKSSDFWGLAIIIAISVFIGIWIFGIIGNDKETDQTKSINYKQVHFSNCV